MKRACLSRQDDCHVRTRHSTTRNGEWALAKRHVEAVSPTLRRGGGVILTLGSPNPDQERRQALMAAVGAIVEHHCADCGGIR